MRRHFLSLLLALLPVAPVAAQQAQPPAEPLRGAQPPEQPAGEAPPPEAAPPEASVPASDDPDGADEGAAAASRVPLAEIRRYVAVYNAVKEAYVDSVDDRALMQSAIAGLLLDLIRTAPTWTRPRASPSTSRPPAPTTASAWNCCSRTTTP